MTISMNHNESEIETDTVEAILVKQETGSDALRLDTIDSTVSTVTDINGDNRKENEVEDEKLNNDEAIEKDGEEEHNYDEGSQEDLFKEPLIRKGIASHEKCHICLDIKRLYLRDCCNFPICDECFQAYLVSCVDSIVLHMYIGISCPNYNCNTSVFSNEILARLPTDKKSKFYHLLVDANKKPCEKTCPQCSNVKHVTEEELKLKRNKNGFLVICFKCDFRWCFSCHAPWHSGITCSKLKKADKLLKQWSKKFVLGQINARRCPKCKIYIQRREGCSHMRCELCNVEFCYECGVSYSRQRVPLLGHEFLYCSIFHHAVSLTPNPVLQWLLRVGIVLAIPICLALSPLALIVIPTWVLIKQIKRCYYSRKNRANQDSIRGYYNRWGIDPRDYHPSLEEIPQESIVPTDDENFSILSDAILEDDISFIDENVTSDTAILESDVANNSLKTDDECSVNNDTNKVCIIICDKELEINNNLGKHVSEPTC